MKAKWVVLLGCILWVGTVLIGGNLTASAEPKGEITIVTEYMGHEVPIPYIEMPQGFDYMKLLYDPLMGVTPDGRLSTEHGIAQKREMSPDALTWTFYLRKGIKFHDGVELTAKDVKFTIEQAMRPDCIRPNGIEIKKVVKSVEIKDPYTLIVRCKEPTPFLDNLFSDLDDTPALIVPKDYYEKVGKDEFQKHPIGSGPYKWHSQMAGSSIKLEATDRHWRDGVPRYKFVNFRIIPEETSRVAMLMTGEADITSISPAKVNEVQKAGLQVVSQKDVGMVTFHPNMQWTSPAFSDIRFRKALNFAIDREAIMKHIFKGKARPASTWPGSVMEVCGGVPSLKPYPYNPEEAKRLLKEAGFVGYEFEVPSYKRPLCPEFHDLVQAVCGYWEKMGLKPKIFMTDWSTFNNRFRTGNTQGTISGMDSSNSPSVPSLLVRIKERTYGKYKRSIMQDPKVDEMLDRASNSLNPTEVAKLLVDAYVHFYNQYQFIPICHINREFATTKRIPEWDLGMRRQDRNYNGLIRQP